MKCTDFLNTADYNEILTPDEKAQLLRVARYNAYNKGEPIVKQGEEVTEAIFILNGFVKVHSEFSRRTVIFNIIGPKKMAVLGPMVCSTKHAFNLTAIDEVSVCLIDIGVIRRIANSNSKFAFRIIEILNTSMLDYIEHALISLTQNNIHGRLANAIIFLSETVFNNHNFDLLLSRKELSQLCNISRENVIKVLYEFNNDGLIRLNGKKIHILLPENLRRIANHG